METRRRPKIRTLLEPLMIFAFLATIYLVYRFHNGGRLAHTEVLETADSYYNTISVLQSKDGIRHMVFGYKHHRYIESTYNPADPMELQLRYMQLMTLGAVYDANPHNVLSIGMGAGQVSSYLLTTLPQIQYTEVELDPEVVRLARKDFGYRDMPRRMVVVEDGRKFLMGHPDSFDLIMLDAYRGSFVPFHLLTREFYIEVKKHLTPGGIVVQNVDSTTLLFDTTMATLRQGFQQTECFAADGNLVVAAYDGPRKSDAELRLRAQSLDAQYHFRYPLEQLLGSRSCPATKADAKPLTDDFAPVDALQAIDAHNRKRN